MKKTLLSVCTILLGLVLMSSVPEVAGQPQKRTIYAGIAFYNLENLFDTLHDAGKNDYEYLPDGANHWDALKYSHKLNKLARVLSELCTERVKGGAAFIGVSEVENANALSDLVAQPLLAEKGFKFLHIEGDDARGVDVACLYNPKMFKPRKSELISTTEAYKKFTDGHITRGIFHVEGSLLGEPFHFLVNHWPSRANPSENREFIARIVRQAVDSIQKIDPNARIVIMGDLNDDPDNKSVTEALGAKLSKKKIQHQGDLYDPWNDMLRKKGQGTLLYDNMWNLFDQIIFTANLLGDDRSTFKFFKNEIYMPGYMTTTEGRFTGAPRRTAASGVWQDGYSDHFPTQIYLVKEL
jgi:hypothetical protein